MAAILPQHERDDYIRQEVEKERLQQYQRVAAVGQRKRPSRRKPLRAASASRDVFGAASEKPPVQVVAPNRAGLDWIRL